MTIKNDAKIEEELSCHYKIHMRNFQAFPQALESLKELCFTWVLVTKVYNF